MGKILGALLIWVLFVLGLSEGFRRQKDLNDVRAGERVRCIARSV